IGAVTDTDITGDALTNLVSENAAAGTQVGITALATDAGDTVSYTLSSNPGNLFAIDSGTGVVTLIGTLDFETAQSHTITVLATSSDTSTSSKEFIINVGDVKEGIEFTANEGGTTIETGASVGDVVARFSATDLDGDTVSYTIISGNDEGYFVINSVTGDVSLTIAGLGALQDDIGNITTINMTVSATNGSVTAQASAVIILDEMITPTIDLSAVSDSGLSNSDNITSVHTPIISGIGEVGAAIVLKVGSNVIGQTTVGSDGRYSVTTTSLTSGVHIIEVISTDAVGNMASKSMNITIDDTGLGGITVDAITTNNIIDKSEYGTEIELTGAVSGEFSAGDTVKVTVNGTTYVGSVDSNGSSWTITGVAGHDLSQDLTLTIYAEGYDIAGNKIEANVNSIHTAFSNENPVAQDDITVKIDAQVSKSNYSGMASTATKLEDTGVSIHNETTQGIFQVGNDGSYVVVWGSHYRTWHNGLSMQKFDVDGNKVGEVISVDGPKYTLGTVVTSLNDAGDYMLSWTAGNGTTADVTAYTKRYNADGTSEATITLGNARQATLVAELIDDTMVYAWQNGGGGIYRKEIGLNGDIQATQYISGGTNPEITELSNGNYILSWTSGAQTVMAMFDSQHNSINTNQSQNITLSNVFEISGGYIVVGSANSVLKIARYSDDNMLIANSYASISVAGSSSNDYPSVVNIGDQGNYVITWRGVLNGQWQTFVKHYNADGTSDSPVQNFDVGVNGGGHVPPVITAVGTDGDYVIAWGGVESTNYDIYSQRFHSDGTAAGDILSHTGENSSKNATNVYILSVDDDGSYALSYVAVDDDGDQSVYAVFVDGDDNIKLSYEEGSTGDFDITVSADTDNTITAYVVTYSTGTLTVNGVTYPSGSTISAALWSNVKLLNATGTDFDLTVEVLIGNNVIENDSLILDVLANDYDSDGDTLSITHINGQDISTNPMADITDDNNIVVGSLQVIAGKITFVPNEQLDKLSLNEVQQLSFAYTISDGYDGVDSATATFNVIGTNDAPIINTLTTTLDEDALNIVIANVHDIDGTIDVAASNAQTTSGHGSVSIAANGNVIYTPDADYNGIDTVTLVVFDNDGMSSKQVFNITITAVNDDVAELTDVNNSVNRIVKNAAIGTEVGITASAIDVDDAVTYSLSSNPSNLFQIDSTTGVVSLAGVLSTQTATSHDIEVLATSVDGSTSTETFSISVVSELLITNITDDSAASDTSVVTLHGTGGVVGNTIKFEQTGAAIFVDSKGDPIIYNIPDTIVQSNGSWTVDLSSLPDRYYSMITAIEVDNSNASLQSSNTVNHDQTPLDGASSYLHSVDGDYQFTGVLDDNIGRSDITFINGELTTIEVDDLNDQITIDAGAGDDIYIYSFDSTQDTITLNEKGQVVVFEQHTNDIITLIDFERFTVDDIVYTKEELFTPTIIFTDDANDDGTLTSGELAAGVLNIKLGLPPVVAVGDTFVYTINGVQTSITINAAHVSAKSVDVTLANYDDEVIVSVQLTNANNETTSSTLTIDISQQPNVSSVVGLAAGYNEGNWAYHDINLDGVTSADTELKISLEQSSVTASFQDMGQLQVKIEGVWTNVSRTSDIATVTIGTGISKIETRVYFNKSNAIENTETMKIEAWTTLNGKDDAHSDTTRIYDTSISEINNTIMNARANWGGNGGNHISDPKLEGVGSLPSGTILKLYAGNQHVGTWTHSYGTNSYQANGNFHMNDNQIVYATAQVPGMSVQNLGWGHMFDKYPSWNNHNVRMNSPIVLDLDNDGIETLVNSEGVNFDIDADGDLDKTGWINGDDGLLVRDINQDGIINDASELFGEEMLKLDGSKASDGFDALAQYDSNKDGVINENDELWEELLVWQDKNSDGITQEGELLTLAQADVSEISLSYSISTNTNNGNILGLIGTYLNGAGETNELADVWFAYEDDVENAELLIGDDKSTVIEVLDTPKDVTIEAGVVHHYQSGTEGIDVIQGFELNQDKLDLPDMLNVNDDNTIETYLSITSDENGTTIEIDVDKDGETDQIIVLDGLDLTEALADNASAVINTLFDNIGDRALLTDSGNTDLPPPDVGVLDDDIFLY
ncbi:MAG: Ig-like domain-containing protein, partial [Psychrobium sp.]|nr:Ig-like domain-containing protein [Psychrobium sp.]